MAKNEFLGRGFSFPVRVRSDGSFRLSEYEENIKQSIQVILSTAPGERIMRPKFGCGIQELTFAPLNSATIARIDTIVTEALIEFEPRIEIVSVETKPDHSLTGKLAISLEYRVRETNNAFNYVYDFYLHEGNG